MIDKNSKEYHDKFYSRMKSIEHPTIAKTMFPFISPERQKKAEKLLRIHKTQNSYRPILVKKQPKKVMNKILR